MQSGETQRFRASFATRLQLLVGFSVLVALFVAALALGLGKLLRQSITESSLSGAEQTAQVFVELELGPEEYKRSGALTNAAPGDLDVAVKTSSTLRAARLWGRDQELLYWSGRKLTSRPSPPAEALQVALRGEIESIVAPEVLQRATDGPRSPESLLKIYMPIALAGDHRPRGALELHLPYAPVQAKIDGAKRGLAVLLGLGALLFYGALLPTVLRGSRALADLYQARQAALQRRLRRAMRDDELALVYQPKLDLLSERIEAVEALLRWHLPDGQTVSPAEFIPLVEPTPVMGDLTLHVFDLAARQCATWARQDIHLDIAVNISACDLRDEGLPARLAERAAAHGLSPERFTLELTESAVSRGLDRDLQTLKALRARGFTLSIDDFGTGESSLSRIRVAEFQEVKIDRSFVRHLDEEHDPVLVASIINLAQALGARVVAEGVESEAAARCLRELGCDAMQGFQLARPLPPEELAEWLRHFSAEAEERKVGALAAV